MADFDSSLPIRTEADGDVVVKISDATVPAQQLAVESDGSVNVNASLVANSEIKITDGTDDLAINGDGSINATVSATNLDIRDLTFAADKVDASGSTVALDSATLTALENITVSATNLDIRDLTHASDSVKVGDGTDFLAVNADGSINVVVAASATPVGTSVADYDTQASLASAASDTHTYTSTGNFYLSQISASASGKMKIVVAVNGATKLVMFNSTANPNMVVTLDRPILATNTQTVTIARTNLDNQTMDVYSTVIGFYP